MPIEIGQLLEGKYRVIRLIGQGGMGAVYEGENQRIKRRVAIKVLHAAAASDPELVTRFEREAQAAGRIGSDHILEILDLGSLPSGDHYIVMEFLDGESLRARIDRLGRLPPHHAIGIVLQVLAGLAAAHRAQIVHRDLKPENIFIVREKAGSADFAKIIDFGISKFNALATDVRVTRTGMVMGTPLYMSPEQASGADTDLRSDLYAIGVILFEALSGRPPFTASNYNELILKIALNGCPTLAAAAPDLPPELVGIVDKATSRDVNARFQSADAFGEALGRFIAHSTGQDTSGGRSAVAPQGTIAWPFDGKPGSLDAPAGTPPPTPGQLGGSTPREPTVSANPTAAGWGRTGRTEPPSKSRTGVFLAAVGSVITIAVAVALYLAIRPTGSSLPAAALASAPPSATAAELPPVVDLPKTAPSASVASPAQEPPAPSSPGEAVGHAQTSPPIESAPAVRKAAPSAPPPNVAPPRKKPNGPRTETTPDLGY